MILSRM